MSGWRRTRSIGSPTARRENRDGPRPEELSFVPLEKEGEKKGDRDPGQLRGLDLESREPDPRLRPCDARSEQGKTGQDERRDGIETRRVLEEDPVVDREEHGCHAESHEREKGLFAAEVSARRPRRRGVDHRDPDQRQGEGDPEEPEVELRGEGLAQP